MKKYKHKFTNDIVEFLPPNYYHIPGGTSVHKKYIENCNDWEEIIKKDYEILSYYAKNISSKGDNYVDPTYIWKQKSPGFWSRFYDNQFYTGPYSTEVITNHDGYGIHSVKRLSDNEIFTIGEKFKHNFTAHYDKLGEITKFDISNDQIEVYFKRGSDSYTLSQTLKTLTKLKQPLFKTEDGVDIFENTDFIWIAAVNESYGWRINEVNSNSKFSFNNVHKLFLIKEKAQEYIDNNKPQYSLQNLADCFIMFDKDINNFNFCSYIQKAKNCVSKLNK